MADNTNAQIVRWANLRARTICDSITKLSYALRAYQADYAAAGMATLVNNNTPANNIADGSDIDGRTRLTGTQLQNLIAGINQLVTAFDASVTGVGSSITTISGGIQVNGSTGN